RTATRGRARPQSRASSPISRGARTRRLAPGNTLHTTTSRALNTRPALRLALGQVHFARRAAAIASIHAVLCAKQGDNPTVLDSMAKCCIAITPHGTKVAYASSWGRVAIGTVCAPLPERQRGPDPAAA